MKGRVRAIEDTKTGFVYYNARTAEVDLGLFRGEMSSLIRDGYTHSGVPRESRFRYFVNSSLEGSYVILPEQTGGRYIGPVLLEKEGWSYFNAIVASIANKVNLSIVKKSMTHFGNVYEKYGFSKLDIPPNRTVHIKYFEPHEKGGTWATIDSPYIFGPYKGPVVDPDGVVYYDSMTADVFGAKDYSRFCVRHPYTRYVRVVPGSHQALTCAETGITYYNRETISEYLGYSDRYISAAIRSKDTPPSGGERTFHAPKDDKFIIHAYPIDYTARLLRPGL